MQRPLLVYDGDCGFCRRWIDRWRHVTGDRVDYAPSQEVAERFPEIPRERFDEAVYLMEPGGGATRGAEAVFRALCHGGHPRALQAYRAVPGAAAIAERIYRFVARHRVGFSRLSRWLSGEGAVRPSWFLSRWLFLRMLGLIYLIAFVSLGVQIDGLVGTDGILPLDRYLGAVGEQLGPERYWRVPTLSWLDPGDGFLHFLCWGGAFLALLVVAGILTGPVLLVLWIFYLSLTTSGQVFLHFQWDILLLEVGLLAIFFAPARLWPRLSRERPPSTAFLWLLRWLLFRLMFLSGAVKLLSGDATWSDLTALDFHYQTQPLPTWVGWYAHQLPGWLQKASVLVMFGIELAVPFLIFFPRRIRHAAVVPLALLQVLILLTGNYGFFNWLTLALCILLLDDAALRRFVPGRLSGGVPDAGARPPRFRKYLLAPIAVVILVLGSLQLVRGLGAAGMLPEPALQVLRWAAPARSVNTYGLFAVMTTERPEIILEGSFDGRTWEAYEFRWKPGDPTSPPAFVAPHMPRLDWQMWFAALGNHRANPWFRNLRVRLLQGSPDVLSLLRTNPFPDDPPIYLRATVHDYRFTDFETRRAEGTWWRREEKGPYAPTLTRRR